MISLFKKKYISLPTIYGWFLLTVLGAFLFWVLLNSIYPFLSGSKKAVSKTLVVEGWIPDSGIKNAVAYYRNNGYNKMIVTGVPITQWTYSSPFSNMADATKETMKRNFFKDSIVTASIPNTVLRDRTFATAVALKMEAEKSGFKLDSFDLYSMGAHARRSHLMFSKAFPNSKIGLIVDTDPSFDPAIWYKTSRGFRIVFSEFISFFYSRLFFYPKINDFEQLISNGRYLDKITADRFAKDRLFADTLTSPLTRKQIEVFEGLPYYDVKPEFLIKASFKTDTSEAAFRMQTTTERLPLYRKYGKLLFQFNDTLYSLSAFQNLDLLKTKPEYTSLFIPFKDLTNGAETYGGGRYLDIKLPENDTIMLDFNLAYNPYCAYDERWSCPLPPFENHLQTKIKAGELKFKKNTEDE